MDKFISIPFLIFLPMLMSFLIMSPLFTNNEISIRRFVKSFCGIHFLYTVFMLALFNHDNPYVSQISFFGTDWIQSLGIKFSFKIDAVSMILTTLTSFVFLIASISSKMNIRKNHKFYYSMFLLLMSAILGIFTANDMFVFFMFWELELIPTYFLIGGNFSNEYNPESKNSAIKFVLFTFLGSWNDLLWPLIVIEEADQRTLTAGLSLLNGQYDREYASMMAATVLSAIPVLLIYIFAQKYLLQGIQLNSVNKE